MSAVRRGGGVRLRGRRSGPGPLLGGLLGLCALGWLGYGWLGHGGLGRAVQGALHPAPLATPGVPFGPVQPGVRPYGPRAQAAAPAPDQAASPQAGRPAAPVAAAPAATAAAARPAAPALPPAPRGMYSLGPLNTSTALSQRQVQLGRVTLAVISGGLPVSREILTRQGVPEFVRQNHAEAGVNGTFFVDAALRSMDGRMIGPVMNQDVSFRGDQDARRLRVITGRPLVIWSRRQIALAEFDPASMNHLSDYPKLLPGATNAFLAGAWLVHKGQPLSEKQLLLHAPSDMREARPRVFFGITAAGVPVIGASLNHVGTPAFARVVAAAGVREAVMLDSGYSTSLVFRDRLLAVGNPVRSQQSRPVPHAIVLLAPTIGPSDTQAGLAGKAGRAPN